MDHKRLENRIELLEEENKILKSKLLQETSTNEEQALIIDQLKTKIVNLESESAIPNGKLHFFIHILSFIRVLSFYSIFIFLKRFILLYNLIFNFIFFSISIFKVQKMYDQASLIKLATSILNDFGSSDDLNNIKVRGSDSADNQRMTLISSLYLFEMPLILKNNLECMLQKQKSSSSILRELINGLQLDQADFANSNAETLLVKFPIIDKACRGNY